MHLFPLVCCERFSWRAHARTSEEEERIDGRCVQEQVISWRKTTTKNSRCQNSHRLLAKGKFPQNSILVGETKNAFRIQLHESVVFVIVQKEWLSFGYFNTKTICLRWWLLIFVFFVKRSWLGLAWGWFNK